VGSSGAGGDGRDDVEAVKLALEIIRSKKRYQPARAFGGLFFVSVGASRFRRIASHDMNKRLWPYAKQREGWMMERKVFLEQTSNLVEGLCNLTYLIGEEADRPEQVRYYAGLSEQRLQSMIELLRGEC
jgi:hypothetical protein